mgnify:CR=1 FL=1
MLQSLDLRTSCSALPFAGHTGSLVIVICDIFPRTEGRSVPITIGCIRSGTMAYQIIFPNPQIDRSLRAPGSGKTKPQTCLRTGGVQELLLPTNIPETPGAWTVSHDFWKTRHFLWHAVRLKGPLLSLTEKRMSKIICWLCDPTWDFTSSDYEVSCVSLSSEPQRECCTNSNKVTQGPPRRTRHAS